MGDLNYATHFGTSNVAPIGPSDRKIGYSPIEFRTSYINNLPQPVTLAMRSGLKYTLPPQYSLTSSKLIIRVEIIIHHSVRMDIQKTLSAINDSSSSDLKVIKEAFSFQVDRNLHNGAILYIDYTLSMDDLRTYGGTIYHHSLDLMISLDTFENMPCHPYSEEGIRYNPVPFEKPDGFYYTMELVDNLSRFGPRYFNIGKRIHKVNSVKDITRKDGVYVGGNSSVTSEIDPTSTGITYFPLEVAEVELGLCRSYEDASHVTIDRTSERRHSITLLEHETTIAKIKAQMSIAEHDLAELEKTKELQILTREREKHAAEILALRERTEHELKIERERVKDHFESRSYSRKDESELLKWVPSVIVGIGSVILAIKAFS